MSSRILKFKYIDQKRVLNFNRMQKGPRELTLLSNNNLKLYLLIVFYYYLSNHT